MTEPNDPNNTELVLPIICPNCAHSIDLSMIFALLPPKEKEIIIQENETNEQKEA